jgi:hypothetical protein
MLRLGKTGGARETLRVLITIPRNNKTTENEQKWLGRSQNTLKRYVEPRNSHLRTVGLIYSVTTCVEAICADQGTKAWRTGDAVKRALE